MPLADFGRLFGYNGLYDTFFREKLASLVDTTRAPGRGRHCSGSTVGGSRRDAAAFRGGRSASASCSSGRARRTRNCSSRSRRRDLDAGALRFTLEVDGQTVDYRHAAPRAVAITWPGPKPNLVVATFEERSGGRPNLVFEGPVGVACAWSDAARVDRESEVRYAMTISAGGHEAKLTLEAPSLRNPYAGRDLQQFRCE